jgi:hypothetical protein
MTKRHRFRQTPAPTVPILRMPRPKTPIAAYRQASQPEKDAAARISEAYNLHVVAHPDNVGKYIACRLDDGSSDGTLYDTWKDAIRDKDPFADLYCYPRIIPSGMVVEHALAFLKAARRAHVMGLRFTDPDDVRRGRGPFQ